MPKQYFIAHLSHSLPQVFLYPQTSHLLRKWRMVGQRRLQNFSRQKVKALNTRISAAHLCDVMSEKNCSLNGHVHYPQLSIEKTPVDIAKKIEVVGTL